MACSARIRNLQRFRGRRGDEFEGVSADIDISNRLLDLRHVAAHALIPGTAGFMMRVRLNGRRVGAVRRVRAVTFEAQDVHRFYQISIVFRAVNIVAAKAAHAVRVHLTGNKIIALHPVFVCGSVGEVCE